MSLVQYYLGEDIDLNKLVDVLNEEAAMNVDDVVEDALLVIIHMRIHQLIFQDVQLVDLDSKSQRDVTSVDANMSDKIELTEHQHKKPVVPKLMLPIHDLQAKLIAECSARPGTPSGGVLSSMYLSNV